jgi:hypothetical protein
VEVLSPRDDRKHIWYHPIHVPDLLAFIGPVLT